MIKYNEDHLWNVTPQETSGWLQKKACVYCKDGSKVEGTIDRIGRNALPLSNGVPPEARTLTDLTIGDHYVDFRDMKSLEVEE